MSFTFREPVNSIAYQFKNYTGDKIKNFINKLNLKTTPLKHQEVSLAIASKNDTFLYALDMGTGKSKLGIDIISMNRNKKLGYKTIIVCPPIVMVHWKNEIEKHSNDFSVCVLNQINSLSKLKALLFTKKDIVIISVNFLPSLLNLNKHLRDKLLLKSKEFSILLIDEAHSLKNPYTKTFKATVRFFLSIKKRYLLTGTPIGNSYISIWSLYYLLDKNKTFNLNYTKFLQKYFIKQNKGRYYSYKYRSNLFPELLNIFWSKAIRYTEEECTDLPDKIYTILNYSLTKEQVTATNLLLNSNKENIVFALMRITGGVDFKVSPKLDLLFSLVQSICIDKKKKLVVWCYLQEENKYLAKVIAYKFNIATVSIYGGITNKQFKLDSWKNDDIPVLIANQKSLGVGINLLEANYCCFYSNSFSLIDRKQTEKRIHRNGQINTCYYYDLVGEGTVDELILSVISKATKNFVNLTKDSEVIKALKSS